MKSDDLTALATISMGALASAAVTFGVMAAYDGEQEAARLRVESVVVSERTVTPRPRVVVDYAIIRYDGEGMVGPEGPGSGWEPPALELRYRPSR